MPAEYKVHFCLVKQWEIRVMSPPGAVPANVEHRVMQKHNFPWRLRGQEIALGERELFIGSLLEVEVQRQNVHGSRVVGIPSLIAGKMHVLQIIARVLLMIANGWKNRKFVDHTR